MNHIKIKHAVIKSLSLGLGLIMSTAALAWHSGTYYHDGNVYHHSGDQYYHGGGYYHGAAYYHGGDYYYPPVTYSNTTSTYYNYNQPSVLVTPGYIHYHAGATPIYTVEHTYY